MSVCYRAHTLSPKNRKRNSSALYVFIYTASRFSFFNYYLPLFALSSYFFVPRLVFSFKSLSGDESRVLAKNYHHLVFFVSRTR